MSDYNFSCYAVLMDNWHCADCGWPWPLPGPPPEDAECDNCGGELVQED